MTFQRTDRGKRESQSPTPHAQHQVLVEAELQLEPFNRFGRWLDRELARLEAQHVLVGARPTRILRR